MVDMEQGLAFSFLLFESWTANAFNTSTARYWLFPAVEITLPLELVARKQVMRASAVKCKLETGRVLENRRTQFGLRL